MRLGTTVALALAIASPAHADNRAVIDQVVLEPSALGGQRLRIYVDALSLQGQLLELPESGSPRVTINGSRLDAPYALGTYAGTGTDTAIAILVQSSFDFTDAMPVIAETLDTDLLGAIGEKTTQVAVLTYGESLGPGKLGSLRAARGRATSLASDGSVGEPALLDSIERALGMLGKAQTKPEGRPLRKLIVVIGDGRDASNDRDRVTRIGKRAGVQGVRIHTLGYSPKDVRRPLLTLGELSKRSFGTFRWVRGARADSWSPAFQQLATEIQRQAVITYFLPADQDVSGAKLKLQLVGREELTALNEAKIPAVACNKETCEADAYCAADRCVTPMAAKRRGVLGWILLVGGIAVGALVVLGTIGFVITKRQALAQQVGVPSAPVAIAGVSPQASQRQPPTSLAPVSQPPNVRAPPRLYVVNGPYAGRELPLKHGFFVGKSAGCDLLLDDNVTSGHHAQFVMDASGWRLFDYGSTNGTFVNGQRITDCMLEHGATIKIGSTELRFLAQ